MFFELIALGGWACWSVIVLVCVLEFIFVGQERAWPAMITLFIFGTLMAGFSDLNIVNVFKESWQQILIGLAVYIAVAPMWAIWKWYRRSVRRGAIYAKCLETWGEKNMPEGVKITSINDIPIDKRMAFFNDLKDDYYNIGEDDEHYGRENWNISYIGSGRTGDWKHLNDREIIDIQKQILKKVLSSPKENKERITVWMAMWPFSILTTFIFDFMYDVFDLIRISLAGLFIKISRLGFGKYSKDFDSVKVEKEI